MKVFEYGAMSSKYSCQAEDKLVAYVAMVAHYDRQAHLLMIYGPEESKADTWFNPLGRISERLDEIYGGDGAFDKYVDEHIDEVLECMKTIKRLV